MADGGQTSVPWRLSRSVIDSVGPAGAEFARSSLPNLPFRSEACPLIGGERRFTIMKGATPTFMPDCDVVVIRGLVWEEA